MVQTITFLGVFLPKSLLLLLSSFLIYDFHATFDRGLKVRLFCSPQCLWVKFIPTKRRFWKEEQKMKSGFSKHFSTVRGPNWVLTPLESTRKSGFHLLFLLPTSSFGEHKLACVSTQQSGRFTMESKMMEKKCVELAWLLSTHVCKFLR